MKAVLSFLIWLATTLVIFALIPLIPLIYLAELLTRGGMVRRILLAAGALVVVAALLLFLFWNRTLGDPQKEYIVQVHPRDNAQNLYFRLAEAGLPVNRRFYSLLMTYTKIDRQLKPGRYRLKGGITHYQLVSYFRKEQGELVKVTIPEGFTIRRIIPLLAKEIPVDSSALARLFADSSYFRSFQIDAPGFEGYLFPETYSFFPYAEARDLIAEMVMMFRSVMTPEMLGRARELGMSLNEVVTLASMIEAEAADGSEQELISSVFHNRLRLGWRLQCDPTVIYALGGLDRPLSRRDLDYDSPYNTYLYYGLPPGPICSPGLASIKAALYPTASNYTYFVATGKGTHVFTASLSDHNHAAGAIRRTQRKAASGRVP